MSEMPEKGADLVPTRASPVVRALKVIATIIASLFAVAAVIVVGVVVVTGAMAGYFSHHANDAELMRTFAEHGATFNRLVAMSDSDSAFVRIAPKFTQPEMPPDRWNRYRAVFDTLHLGAGLSRYAAGDTVLVSLLAWCEGFVFAGSCKGYIFSTVPRAPLATSLDDSSPLLRSFHGIAYRAIAPRWYLFYHW